MTTMPEGILQTLLERRDAAQGTYDEFINPLLAAGDALSEEQTARRGELRQAITALDERIDEVNAAEARDTELRAVRDRIGATASTGNAQVNEARVYGEGSPNSYYADVVRASGPMWKGHDEARQRLNQHSFEVSVEIAQRSDEGRRAERMIREAYRTENGVDARTAIDEMCRRGNAGAGTGREELRISGMTSGSSSGGAFVTPVYLEPDYVPYREAGRAFIDAANGQDLPEYGLAVYLPAVTGPAGVAAQGTENTAVQETDPTAGYLTANVTTEAGQVNVSQQLIDRTGPNFSFDKMVHDQLMRDLNPKLDRLALVTALAGAGAITYTDATGFTVVARTTPGTGGFYGKVSGAKAAVRTAAGTVQNPTHLFLQPTRWEYISGWADTNGRPVIVPDYAGPFNAAGGGSRDGDAGFEGATGYRLNGLPVFQDLNIPTPGTGADQAIVANMSEINVWESAPVPRVLPQTNAATLSVLLQVYEYIAVLVRYPLAVQAISGSGMAAITF